jgi:hypothetical protein
MFHSRVDNVVPAFFQRRARNPKGYRPPAARYTLMVLLLLTGLLNFPSIAACGAELPHAHSLFMLADHHHEPDGELASMPQEHAPAASGAPITADSTPAGPILQDPSLEFVSGGPVGLAIVTITASRSRGASAQIDQPRCHLPRDVTITPASPPPRRIV